MKYDILLMLSDKTTFSFFSHHDYYDCKLVLSPEGKRRLSRRHDCMSAILFISTTGRKISTYARQTTQTSQTTRNVK